MNPDGTPDKNALSLYETSNGARLAYETLDGAGDTAALKITSRATDIKVTVGTIFGGSENCVDINNECQTIYVQADVFEVRGKYALSAKTSNAVTFTGHIKGTPSKWHINLGSWSDQSKAVQTNTLLALTADSYPIVVWLGNAELPVLDVPANYKLIGFGCCGPMVRGFVMFAWGVAKMLHLPI